jgi:hypothetical protein
MIFLPVAASSRRAYTCPQTKGSFAGADSKRNALEGTKSLTRTFLVPVR